MKKILIFFLILLVSIQFIRIDMKNPKVDPKKDYIEVTEAPKEIQEILKTSCYDCHSNETVYPWYANIAPISWYVKDHINQGRRHVNFSEYGDYNQYQIKHIQENLSTSVKKGWMPLDSYLQIHKDAELSKKNREILVKWFDEFLPEQSK